MVQKKQKQGAEAAAKADKPLKKPAARLGEILVETSAITQDQLEEALVVQKLEGGFLGQKLIELGYLDQQTLTLLLVKQCKIPHLNLLDYQIDPKVVDLIPEELCLKHKILPVDKMGKIFTVAMVDPLNLDALTAIRESHPELRIKPILCDWPHFEIVSNQIFNPPEEPEKSEEDDQLFGLKLPAKKSPVKVSEGAQDENVAPVDSELEEVPVAVVSDDVVSPALDVDALAASIVSAIRGEISSPAALESAEGGQTGLIALERKLESLANSVSRIAQASDVFQAARSAEEHEVAEGIREDLKSGATGTGHGVSDLKHGSGRSMGAEGDAAVRTGLDTGAPLGGYSFESFVAGDANLVTVEMAKAVAASPGKDYNPLFVCGSVGLGKTHLVNAIGNHLGENAPDMRVGYTSASRFAEHVVTAREQGMGPAFREAYSQWDVLILDDVQFLGGHVEAQEEFFHLFNSLQQGGRQIVIAGDKPPQKLGLLEDRLVSRFEGGMLANLLPPEWETRLEILRRVAGTKGEVPEEVLAMVAMQYPKDVRRLIGCLQKVMSHAELKGTKVTCELANGILMASAVEAA